MVCLLRMFVGFGLLAQIYSHGAIAQVCPSAANLVSNCGFDLNINGYTPQLPGDVISHTTSVGASQLGAMRVRDTDADSGSDAEAQACVNLGANRSFTLTAQFRAVSADACFVGFDEFLGSNCSQPNGNFVSSTTVAVNAGSFSVFSQEKVVSAQVQSIEVVLLCQSSAANAEFFVDDVGVISAFRFANGFE